MENWSDDSIMNSLSNMQRAEPSPFLFTRIEARLQKVTQLSVAQVRLAAAGLIILLAVDLWVITSRQTSEMESTSTLTSLQAY